MMKLDWKKILPHALAVVVFLVVSIAFFAPEFQGYDLRQGDVNNWKGMSKEIMDYRMLHDEEALWTNSMFGGMPAYQISTVHSSNIYRYFILFFKLGLPGPVGALFVALLGGYVMALFFRIKPWLAIAVGLAVGLSTINVLYLSGGHSSKVMAIAFIPPALGALVYSFRTKNLWGPVLFAVFMGCQLSANHLQMTYYMGILFALVGMAESLRMMLQKEFKMWSKQVALLVIAAVLAILPSTSNLMTTYEYSKFTTRGSSDLTLLKDKGSNTLDSEGLSSNYILEYNYGKAERLSIFIPNAMGGASGPIERDHKESLTKVRKELRQNLGNFSAYWGDQSFTGGAFYFGVFVFVFAVIGAVCMKDSIKWPLIVAALLSLALCVQEMTPLNDWFIHHFPMYNKFRDSKMMLFFLAIIFPLLAGLWIQEREKAPAFSGRSRTFFWSITGLVVFAFVVFYGNPKLAGSFISPQEVKQFDQYAAQAKNAQEASSIDLFKEGLVDIRLDIYKKDAMRSLLLVMLAAVVAFAYDKKWLKYQVVVPIVALVVIADLWSIDARYVNGDKERGRYRHYTKEEEQFVPVIPSQADVFILNKEKSAYPMWESTQKEVETAMSNNEFWKGYKNQEVKKQIAGFSALNLVSDYRVLTFQNPFSNADVSYLHKSIGGYHGAKLKRYQELIEFALQPELKELSDSIQQRRQINVLASLPVLNMLNTKYIMVSDKNPPIVNRHACGSAWFVSEVKKVNTSDEELQALQQIEPLTSAVARKDNGDFLVNSTPDSLAKIDLVSYSPNHITYKSTHSQTATAVFSEIYYPAGWVCRIDGNEVKAAPANYVLRSTVVPAGSHTIDWSFEPASWSTGNTISLAGSSLLLLALFGVAWKERKRV